MKIIIPARPVIISGRAFVSSVEFEAFGSGGNVRKTQGRLGNYAAIKVYAHPRSFIIRK